MQKGRATPGRERRTTTTRVFSTLGKERKNDTHTSPTLRGRRGERDDDEGRRHVDALGRRPRVVLVEDLLDVVVVVVKTTTTPVEEVVLDIGHLLREERRHVVVRALLRAGLGVEREVAEVGDDRREARLEGRLERFLQGRDESFELRDLVPRRRLVVRRHRHVIIIVVVIRVAARGRILARLLLVAPHGREDGPRRVDRGPT
mmetsp:Transcript_10186/g.41249  ORF Transcript_10186/g.41249 Transcript_10186/m.41249 type:complete len:203 (+) Transcript_10186:921-1529(+)